jgi:hypothetical protein
MDWRYALHLHRDYPGIEAGSFCRFRQGLLVHPEAAAAFDRLVGRVRAYGLAEGEDVARSLIDRTCTASRVAAVAAAVSNAIRALAVACPEWLRNHALPHWYNRYGTGGFHWHDFTNTTDTQYIALSLGSDAYYLINLVQQHDQPELAGLLQADALLAVWNRHYEFDGKAIVWRPYCKDGREADFQPSLWTDGVYK